MIDLSLLLLGLFSFVLCFALTPLVRGAFHALDILDRPDGVRKIHTTPIPRVGGIAVMVSYVGSFGIMLLLPVEIRQLMDANLRVIAKLLPAGIVVFAVGVADDLWNLKPWQKLLGQAAAAGLAYWAGVRILHIAEHPVPGWLGLPLTILWLVGCTNAFNLIDGADGIAAGVGFFATVTTLLVAILQNHFTLQVATVPLVGCLIAFLAYNFSPASIFLGDCGSLSIGFLLGCYGVLWVEKCSTLLGLTAPVIALSVPLLDTWLAVARRYIRHRPLWTADNGHIHHRLLARGFTPRRVALTMYVISGLAAAFALLISMAETHYAGLAVVVFCFSALLGIRVLGYDEFRVACRMLTEGKLWQMVNVQLSLESLAESLARAKTADEWWQTLERGCREFGFQNASLQLAGRFYDSPQAVAESSSCWSMRIPLSPSDCIFLTRRFNSAVMPEAVAQFVTILQRALQSPAREMIVNFPQERGPLSQTHDALPAVAGH
jgi:UDP-GlcNAc:undecaprenyl-phosphate GlcNAc-1-phosphate transferase